MSTQLTPLERLEELYDELVEQGISADLIEILDEGMEALRDAIGEQKDDADEQ